MQNTRALIAAAGGVEPTEQQLSWIEMLKSDWQVVADLAGADLILWWPTVDKRFVAVAMCRPASSVTVHTDDVVGLFASGARGEQLREAQVTKHVVSDRPVRWSGLYSVEMECVPVVRKGDAFAVISVERNLASPSRQTREEAWRLDAAEVLYDMIANGEYPYPDAASGTGHGVPRVIDGTVLVDPNGVVLEVSPNANSAMRRLGMDRSLVGQSLVQQVTSLLKDERRVEESLAVVVMGRAPWRTDIEARGSTVAVRAVPLTRNGERLGAVLLTRDVTDQRKHEQQLMTKDATIREIHHRVKNNLQTVSALLRIQERRSDSADVQEALREAGRRVESIAAVHEALSHNVDEVVDFDEVAPRILQMAVKVASTGPESAVQVEGEFGALLADQASALATVLAELVANSVEHGYPGRTGNIWVRANRNGNDLEVTVEDEGEGLRGGTLGEGLGTRIVQVMVRGELGGTIEWAPREGGGTVATLRMRAESKRAEA